MAAADSPTNPVTEVLLDPVVAGALIVVGVVLLVAWRRRSKKNREMIESWEPIYGEIVRKRAIIQEGGGNSYRLKVSFPDRRDREVLVREEIFQDAQEGDKIQLAVHPRRPKHVVHPDIPTDTPAGSVVFMIGVTAAMLGVILAIIDLLVDV